MDNDIVISSDAVSRSHADIKFESGEYVLYDKNSTSGTFVNNKQITRCVLHSGDMVSLADERIVHQRRD